MVSVPRGLNVLKAENKAKCQGCLRQIQPRGQKMNLGIIRSKDAALVL